MARLERLGVGDVERGTGEMTGVERHNERLLIDQAATGTVHEVRPALHSSKVLGADEVMGLG